MKKALIAAVAVALVALAAWLLVSRNNSMPEPREQNAPTELPANDTSASINKDIESLEVGSPDNEFKTIDADLNQL